MRFNAKISAAAAASVMTMSLLFGHGAYAETPKQDRSATKSSEAKPEAAQSTPKPVTVTVQAGDSLTAIAEAHQTTWVRIFNANESIADPNAINPGDTLTIPTADQQLPDRYDQFAASAAAQAQAQAAVASTATTYTTRSYSNAPVNSSSYYVGNGMWCTDYVHSRRPDVPIYGNAGYNWVGAAQAQGKATGTTPRSGAVAVTNGHVAYVESVNSDGSYVVSEMGWNYKAGNYNTRTVSPGAFGQFIY